MRLEMITQDNLADACRLTVKPEQRKFVAPVVESLAEAYASYATAWPRLVYDGDAPVAFIMGAFDPENEIDFFRCGIWRLNVSADYQGKGYGRFAVTGVLDEARRRGATRATVLWLPGEHSPEDFYLRLGFRSTGETFHGQTVGEISL